MIDEEVKVQISQTSWEAAIYNYAMPPRLRCKTTYTVPNSHLMMPSTACVVDKASCHPLALISVYLGVWMLGLVTLRIAVVQMFLPLTIYPRIPRRLPSEILHHPALGLGE